ncbi:chemotaxis protein CheA [Croceicoccus hydrothermalis]|uniref:chemotaxis protein CheA n=1 Tax=Croceicoccus hydrothermalis TaxID=2867964 RepID=UPI001EFA6DE1
MNSEDIQNIFFVECEESLEAAEAGLEECRNGTHDGETINAIFRAVHSIKGGAGAFGYGPLQAFTHVFETLLADVREGTVALTDELTGLLLLSLDCVRDHVEAARSGGTAPEDAALMAQLNEAHENAGLGEADEETAAAPAPAPAATPADDDDLDAMLDDLLGPAAPAAPKEPWLFHMRAHGGAMKNGSEPLYWLRELQEMGGECVVCDSANVPPLDDFNEQHGYFGWTFAMPASVSREQVSEIFDFVGDDCTLAFGAEESIPPMHPDTAEQTAAASADPATGPKPKQGKDADNEAKDARADAAQAASRSPKPQSIRVDLAKLDKMNDGVGELVIAQAMLAQRLADENLMHIEELAVLDALVRDVQEHAMAFRAQPISAVFSRVPRLLRELASSTGKHVNLEVIGESTELDKTVVDRLGEPLTHLIRNAVDHGIESAERRKAAGKDPEGTLTLSAEQKSGRVVIRIADDGAGIDRERVFAKAVANGLISPEAELPDEEIDHLIFAPGFSTAEQVSNISGRGVGMDVVRQNVKELGGRITIESRPGEGTTFVLALPLTLAISDGMVVQVGGQSLVLPLAHVVESLRPLASDLKGMGTSRQLINIRGSFVPIVRLDHLAGEELAIDDPCEGVLVIVDTERCGQAALLVDSITDQRQFVIKSLDTHFRAVESVAGATILGNGRVALIIDVDNLVQSENAHTTLQAAA